MFEDGQVITRIPYRGLVSTNKTKRMLREVNVAQQEKELAE